MYKYLTCCVESDYESISRMTDSAEQIDFDTFVAECSGVANWAASKGYEGLRKEDSDGLTLEEDWHLSYWESEYQEEHCFFLQWSGIEYIWTSSGHGTNFGYYTHKEL